MEKTIIPEFKLVGLQLNKKTTNEDGQSRLDCGNLWQKFEAENYAERIPSKLRDAIYAVYFGYDGDYTKPFSYFIGCKVEIGTEVPPDMVSLNLPEQDYIKVLAKGKMPDCISNCWRDIWKSKIDRAYKYDFEIYEERCKVWNDAEVEILVSVNG